MATGATPSKKDPNEEDLKNEVDSPTADTSTENS